MIGIGAGCSINLGVSAVLLCAALQLEFGYRADDG